MKHASLIPVVALALCLLTSCEKPEEGIAIDTPDWTAETHEKLAVPVYATVFPQDRIGRFDITIDPDDWTEILEDLSNIRSPGPPGPDLDGAYDPIWVPADVDFNGRRWYKAGIRVKGNSSLRTTYQQGIRKFSFKLDFDQFEDTYPDIKNQRFYGFKQLNLNNNFDDQSLLREKVAGDLFRDFGIPSARSAFYEVWVDTGSGPVYYGLYTVVEEMDDTGIGAWFADTTGNLYKPEGTPATWKSGSYTTSGLNLKTNLDAPDYSDARALYDALQSPLRTSDPGAWRTLLEESMDMEAYLRWLAANVVMQNWDTYGRMTHNYYLYNDPARGSFVWIPWDNNEALQEGKMGGSVPLALTGITSQWPLISHIAADPVYFSRYKELTKQFAAEAFNPDRMNPIYDTWSALVSDAASREQSPYTFLKSGLSGFNSALAQLRTHVTSRYALVQKFLVY